jgi:hypothetical protein
MSGENISQMQLAQLREAAKIFLRPMERLPFPVVVEAMTECKVLPAADCRTLLRALADSCVAVVAQSASDPIRANRPNDVSAQVERRLQRRMTQEKLQVEMPRTASGKSPGGYPDLFVESEDGPAYLEIKVSREQNINQGSARNFFYQPVANSKIRRDAPHLLAGFAIKEDGEKKWVLREWTIVDLFFLRVRLKPEYNADNLQIYRPDTILMKGDGAGIRVGAERIEER